VNPDAGGETAGASISPDDPTKVVLAGGAVVPVWAPVVELFASHGCPYARTRKPGAARDELRAVGGARRDGRSPWHALVKPTTTIDVDESTLRTSTFTYAFPGPVLEAVELDDGAYVVAWQNDAVPREDRMRMPSCGLTAVDAAGRRRWSHDSHYVFALEYMDEPALPDALIVRDAWSGAVLHPWDGRRVLSWEER
jgi:hypothetical protein